MILVFLVFSHGFFEIHGLLQDLSLTSSEDPLLPISNEVLSDRIASCRRNLVEKFISTRDLQIYQQVMSHTWVCTALKS